MSTHPHQNAWRELEVMAPYRNFIEGSLQKISQAFGEESLILVSFNAMPNAARLWIATKGTYKCEQLADWPVSEKRWLAEELEEVNQEVFKNTNIYSIRIDIKDHEQRDWEPYISYLLFDVFLADFPPEEQSGMTPERYFDSAVIEKIGNCYRITDGDDIYLIPWHMG